jgi:DNA mismatch endonuclease (patch repair protein)
MASIKGKNTKPEMIVRRYMHRVGLRYRLHAKELPGTPDLVFRSRRIALFVHGCFWHRCPHCRVGRREILSNVNFWLPKLNRNELRDSQANNSLRSDGWKVLTVWECEVESSAVLGRIAAEIRKQLPTQGTRPKSRDAIRAPLLS